MRFFFVRAAGRIALLPVRIAAYGIDHFRQNRRRGRFPGR